MATSVLRKANPNSSNNRPFSVKEAIEEQNRMQYEKVSKEDKFDVLSKKSIREMTPAGLEAVDKEHINTDAVLNDRERIQKLNTEMKNAFDSLIKNVNRLDNYWDGAASFRTISSFQLLKQHLQSRYQQMEQYVQLMKKVIIEGYEETEDVNQNLADSFK